jgi:hypothetical protein
MAVLEAEIGILQKERVWIANMLGSTKRDDTNLAVVGYLRREMDEGISRRSPSKCRGRKVEVESEDAEEGEEEDEADDTFYHH